MDITRFLPYNEYQAAVNANSPTAVNPFATIADLPATPGLSAVLAVGDTGTAGQNIRLVGGLLDISNNSAAPTLSKLEFTSSVGEAQIRTTGLSGAGQNLRIKTSSIGYTPILEGVSSIGVQGFKVAGLGFTSLFAMSPTANRTYTFQNASGTVAFLTDIPATPTTLYTGSGSLSGPTTVTQGTNSLAFTTTIPLGSPASWYEKFQINVVNNEPSAYTKGLYVSTTGANGHTGQFQNITAGNNVVLSPPNNAIETIGSVYILGKDNVVTTNGLLVTNQNGYTGTWAFKNNGNIAQRHEVPVAGNNNWNYGYSLVSVNNCPTDYMAAMNINASGFNSYAAFFSNITSSGFIELCAPLFALIARQGAKGLMVGLSGWGSVVNSAAYSQTGGQVLLGSDTTNIMTIGNGTTAGTTNLWLKNSASATIMTVTDDGLCSLVKGGHTLTLNANGTSTLTELDTTNVGFQLNSTNGYLRMNVTGGAANALIYVNGAATGLSLSGAVAGTAHLTINSTGNVGIGTAPATSKVTVSGDIETINNTNGLIVLDRTNATRYRIYTDGGVLYTEPA